ncbi:23S rRNA m(5)U-1939 methyltransferase [Kytococcus aerolatus]|uniref:23S rRNA m(5)U-1939 methyltransferase n=1 Tax=Kytococcus aerolatus TaxID=592308 RepID=A0A212T3A4_9MICO|nr:TRAM domain-containing protein [Kytococcus aerolatus]SNC60527.1 23S rRNA m(5)U-1939 methyltransferase [Kytococcus aerolatus]
MSSRASRPHARSSALVGAEAELEVGPVAHGGHCVARWEDGRVVFVRHALPGELVRVRVTGVGPRERHLFADAVEVLRAAEGRREAPCRYAGPGGCGGCDLQHAELPLQRELKAQVVREQLQRLAGIDLPVELRELPGPPGAAPGERWRTRVEFALDPAGRPGLRRHRSREVIPVEDCRIATEEVVRIAAPGRPRPQQGLAALDAVGPAGSPAVAVPVDARGRVLGREPVITEATRGAAGESLPVRLGARGFWQAHRGAVAAYVDHVVAGLEPRPGEVVWDLYCGSGAFTVPLARAVGERGAVLGVEGYEPAVDACAAALEEHAPATPADLLVGDVGRMLAAWEDPEGRSADLVVLDPPRAGAGREVMAQVAASGARRVAYVACDPAALARDLGTARDLGMTVESVVGFDAFPNTHHVEAIALLGGPV